MSLNEKFELADRWYSVSDIQNCLVYIMKKHGENISKNNKHSVTIYVNKIENKIAFNIKTGCYLENLMHVTMKLLGITKSKITKNGIGKNVL